MRYGATPDDWFHFDTILDLTADLLPVVSDPRVDISPLSKMKSTGKTPSIVNRQGHAAGLKDWTQRTSTPEDIARWSDDPRLGICVQTRRVRALDIDVEDEEIAEAIAVRWAELIEDESGPALGLRYRENSGKRLLAFIVEGELSKRHFKTEGGLVEFLATGQQFVAVGTHPSGERYKWAGGRPDDLPVYTLGRFERAWRALVREFAVGEAVEAQARAERGAADLEGVEDDVAAWLGEHWSTFGRRGEKLFVECPWKDGHSMDSGESEAAWLLAGTRGFERGHFECRHASCQGRTDDEFLIAVGYSAAPFEDLSTEEAYAAAAKAAGLPAERARLPLPGFKRTSAGDIEAVIENVVRAVESPEACGCDIRFDNFRSELMISPLGEDGWRPFTDADAVDLRIRLAAIRFKPVGKDMMRDAVTKVAADRQFDTATHWLENVVPAWDGVPRIEDSLIRYFGAQNDNRGYSKAVGLYLWTALAGRVLAPGCKVDMVPVLVGEQGLRKSTAVAALAPAEDFFAEVSLEVKDTDLSRKMRGKMVIELGELRGLKSREAESIKAWITSTHERWTPKYMEYETVFARRFVLIGTTNDDEFLGDPTGERRWLPSRVERPCDVEALVRDRLQLWAEARERWRADGVLWREAEDLAKEEHRNFKSVDPWEDIVRAWLVEEDLAGSKPADKGMLRTPEILAGALQLDPKSVGKREEMRLTSVLKALGYARDQKWVDGSPKKVWVPAHTLSYPPKSGMQK